tara:strand:+ start:3138 stop:3386 length:249 start_codon:yes stop_codon:yes gene_type:complete
MRGSRLTHLGAWGMAHGAGLTFFKVPYLRFLYIGSEYLAAKIDPRFMGRDPWRWGMGKVSRKQYHKKIYYVIKVFYTLRYHI